MNLEARKIKLIMALRRAGVSDTAVLSAIERVPRERFVPESFVDQAYENTPLPIGHGQTISQPIVVAMMTQALDLRERDRVLEIGTGCGYQAAVLAKLCRRVYTIERIRSLYDDADQRFRTLGLHNITTRLGDGTKGWPEQASFDRIMVTAGGSAALVEALCAQLVVGGIMVAPVGGRYEQDVVRYRRTDSGFDQEVLWPVRFVPLLADGDSDADPHVPEPV